MPDTEHLEVPAAITDAPQSAPMEPQTDEDAVKPLTNEVDTDDMFVQGGE